MKATINIEVTSDLVRRLKDEDKSIDNYINNLIYADLNSVIKSSTSCFYYDKNTSKLYDFSNQEIDLTKKENLLLYYLIGNTNAFKTYDEIIENCWYQKKNVSIATVKNLIKRIRKKTSYSFIKTHYGEGYSLPTK